MFGKNPSEKKIRNFEALSEIVYGDRPVTVNSVSSHRVRVELVRARKSKKDKEGNFPIFHRR